MTRARVTRIISRPASPGGLFDHLSTQPGATVESNAAGRVVTLPQGRAFRTDSSAPLWRGLMQGADRSVYTLCYPVDETQRRQEYDLTGREPLMVVQYAVGKEVQPGGAAR